MIFDLSISENSYIFGLFQTDGSMWRGSGQKGKFQIELSEKDKDILFKIKSLLNINFHIGYRERTRKTNFSNNSKTCILSICSLQFRNLIEQLGMPYGKKSYIITIPTLPYIEKDYFRGIIDGDGSLGLTSNGFPFLSLCTDSENLAINYNLFLSKITGKIKKLNRNKRDRVYNICITKEDAQKVVSELYYKNCLCLDRKMKLAYDVLSWIRPLTMRKKCQLIT